MTEHSPSQSQTSTKAPIIGETESALIDIIYLAKKEIDKSENEIINLKKLYDESKFFTCRETTQNNVEIHQKTEDEPFPLQ